MKRTKSLNRLIQVMGGISAVARSCDPPVSQSAASQWRRVPVQHVLTLEARCKGKVTRHDMRPDIYGGAPDMVEPSSERIPKGRIVIIQRADAIDGAPPDSQGYGERILGVVTARCIGRHSGKYRVRFLNPFAFNKLGRQKVCNQPMPAAALVLADPATVKWAMGSGKCLPQKAIADMSANAAASATA